MPRRSSSTSAALLSPPILIIFLPAFVILFLIYTLPSFLFLSSHISHILQPTISVKKSWDSLNVFLVVFVILCGVFARKQHEEYAATEASLLHDNNNPNVLVASNYPSSRSALAVPAQQEWFGYHETTNAAPVIKTPEINVVVDGGLGDGGGLRRRSSYPDMRQVESSWETLDDVSNKSSHQFRFFDDFEISNYRTHHHRHNSFGDDVIVRETEAEDDVIVKEIKVDTFVARPPPPPRRNYEAVAARKKEKVDEVNSPEEVTPAKSPAPVPAMRLRSDGSRLERRKSNVKREIAMVWNSVLSKQQKRKRKPKATRNLENDSAETPAPPPPPPPPPPPSSVFQNLFKKGSKPKKTHSLVPTPPPEKVIPPTPPPITFPAAISRRRPPLPTKPINKYYDDNVTIINSGSQSPMIPIPPPPPPFKMPAMRFFVKGDYVKIRSRSSSPELDDDQVRDHEITEKSTLPVNEMNGGDVTGKVSTSVFCPSPDVNTKADNFIARLRDEWRLEKINSLGSTS